MAVDAGQRQPLKAIRRRVAKWGWLRGAPYVLVSFGLAGALVALLWRFIPTRLDVTTNALGYPTRFNFNVFRQWYVYGLLVYVFPLTALGTYIALTHRRRRDRRADRGLAEGSAGGSSTAHRDERPVSPDLIPITRRIGHALRVLGVGLVLGLEASVALQNRTPSGAGAFAATVIAYTVTVFAFAVAARRWWRPQLSLWSAVSLLNGAGTVGCVLALYGVSQATEVSIISTHTVRKVAWMPPGVAVILAAGALIGLALLLRRNRSGERIWSAERWMILLVAVPAAFFVLHARLIGDLGLYSSFEEGQLLVGAHQVLHGAFPWRDILLAHGIFNDALVFIPGMVFFEVSRWGAWAGYYLLVEPVYWLLLYGLVLYLTRARWTYSLLFLAVIVLDTSFLSGFLSGANLRFIPLPLVLGAFALLLRRPTWPRAAAFTGSLLALVVVTPEALIFSTAFIVVLAVFELYTRPPDTPLRLDAVPRLSRCAATGLAWLVVLVIWLAANDALDGFIFYYKTFVPAHILEGMPIASTHTLFFTAGMYVPISLALLYLGALTTAMFMRRSPRNEDWVGAVLAIGAVLYYAKFLGRAEYFHLLQYLAFTTPFLVYVVYRVVESAQSWLAGRQWRSRPSMAFGRFALSGALALGILIPSTGDLIDRARAAPGHFLPHAQSPPTVSRVGYVVPGAVSASQFSNLKKLLNASGGSRPRVWDFSNSPADIYFFEQLSLLTRYDNVSIAIERATQQDVISELEKARPDVVVYNSLTGLTGWDGLPNMVRHYDVSAWILRNYHPVAAYAGFLLFGRNSSQVPRIPLANVELAAPLFVSNLYTDFVAPCDWGYVPNFLAQHPANGARSRRVALQGTGRHVLVVGRVSESIDPANTPVEAFLTHDGVRVGTGRVAANVSLFLSGPGFGFDVDAPIAAGKPIGNLATWVRLKNGTTYRIPNLGEKQVPGLGTIESQRTVWEDRITMPADANDFHWLELTHPSGAPISPDAFALSLVDDANHGIYFATRSDPPRPYVVRLDNCTQWKAMPGATTVLIHSQRQSDLTLRLRA